MWAPSQEDLGGVLAEPRHPPSSRFHVNLLLSDGPEADAALHFNPRLDEGVVVLNSKDKGKWGREERGVGLPFQRGQPFDLLLIATEEGFKVGRGGGGPCRGQGSGVPEGWGGPCPCPCHWCPRSGLCWG